MLFNVFDYSNQLIGQVEASDAVEAWSEAGKRFSNILDIRQIEEPKYGEEEEKQHREEEHYREKGFRIVHAKAGEPKIKTYYHESPFADVITGEGFSMEARRTRDPGDFGWGVYLWPSPRYMPKGYTLEVDVDISSFAVIHDPYLSEPAISVDTPEEKLFRELAYGRDREGDICMATIHGTFEKGHEITREEAAKRIRTEFLGRGIQGLITYHNHRAIEEVVLFDLLAVKGIRRHID